jgi:hypothetical protein
MKKPLEPAFTTDDARNVKLIREAMRFAVAAHPPTTMNDTDLRDSQAAAMEAFWTFLTNTFEAPDPKTAFGLGVRFALAQLDEIRKRHFGHEPLLPGPYAAGRSAGMQLEKQLTSLEHGVWRVVFEYQFQLDHFWWPENDPHPKVNITAIECDGVSAVAIEGPFEFALLVDQPMILLPACRELTVRYEVEP